MHRDCLQPVVESVCYLDWPCFERFLLSPVNTHHRNQRLDGKCSLLVGLQVDVEVVVFAEHARHAGNQFLTVLDQRVDVVSSVLILRGVIQCIFEFYALAAQDNGADGDTLFLIV